MPKLLVTVLQITELNLVFYALAGNLTPNQGKNVRIPPCCKRAFKRQ